VAKSTDEKLKLRANYFNGLAVAIAAVGGFSPAVAFLSSAPAASTGQIVTIVLVCLVLSAALYSLAGRILEGLDE
jgi:hypothetical protein